MHKPQFVTLLTLQAIEGKKDQCLEFIKNIFNDPSMLEIEYFHSQEDPEIIMAMQKWSTYGVFQEYMQRAHENGAFKNTQQIIEFMQITNWIPAP